MDVERWKEIVAHHKKEEEERLVTSERVRAFRVWFAEKPRSEQEIEEYWGKVSRKKWGQDKNGKIGAKTTAFLLWLNEKPRTKGEVADYWKAQRSRQS